MHAVPYDHDAAPFAGDLQTAGKTSGKAASKPLETLVEIGDSQAGPFLDESLFQQCDHTLFVGTSTCAHHNCCIGHAGDDSYAFLCPSDAQIAIGGLDDLIFEAVDKLAETHDRKLESLVLYTSCPLAFMGFDFQRAVRRLEERNILCLRREICRTMPPGAKPRPKPGPHLGTASLPSHPPVASIAEQTDAGPGRPGGPNDAGTFHEQLIEYLRPADEMPTKKDNGIVVVTDGLPFASKNELRQLGEGHPFAWVEGLGDEISLERIERLSSSRFVVSIGDCCLDSALAVADRIGASCLTLQTSYRICEIDKQYQELEAFTGTELDMQESREEALAATERARAAWSNHEMVLRITGRGRPWDLVYALLDYGFRVASVRLDPMSPPHWGAPPHSSLKDPDYLSLIDAYPFMADRIEEFHLPGPGGPGSLPPAGPNFGSAAPDSIRQNSFERDRRPTKRSAPASGDAPTPMGARAFGARPGPMSAPPEPHFDLKGVYWGYSAITQCMEQLTKIARDAHDQEGSPR